MFGLEISGLLYEQIVFIPNFYSDPLLAREHFGSFHQTTNPVHFHLVPSLVLAGSLAYLWHQNHFSLGRKHLRDSILSTFGAVIFSAIVILLINETLFFDKLPIPASALQFYLNLWTTFNWGRILLLAIALKKFNDFKSLD